MINENLVSLVVITMGKKQNQSLTINISVRFVLKQRDRLANWDAVTSFESYIIWPLQGTLRNNNWLSVQPRNSLGVRVALKYIGVHDRLREGNTTAFLGLRRIRDNAHCFGPGCLANHRQFPYFVVRSQKYTSLYRTALTLKRIRGGSMYPTFGVFGSRILTL